MGQPVEQDYSGLGVAMVIVIAVVSIAALVLWIAAIVSVARDQRLTGGGKLLWVAVVLAYPFLGSVVWFAGGRKARLVTTPMPATAPSYG